MLDRDYGSARGRAHCWRTHPGRAAATASSSSGLLQSAWGSSWTWRQSGSATSPSSLPSPSALARRWEGWMLLSALIWANEKVENQVRQFFNISHIYFIFLTFLILLRRKRGQPLLWGFQNHGLISSRPELGGSLNKVILSFSKSTLSNTVVVKHKSFKGLSS